MNQSEKKIQELTQRPFLSIIIPVYNGSHYLSETIASVLQQPCKDFELLLLDDGSTDESLAICNDIHDKKQERWPSIRVFSHPNMGVSKTRTRVLLCLREPLSCLWIRMMPCALISIL